MDLEEDLHTLENRKRNQNNTGFQVNKKSKGKNTEEAHVERNNKMHDNE